MFILLEVQMELSSISRMHEECLASNDVKFKFSTWKMLNESCSLLLTKQVLKSSVSFQNLIPKHVLKLQQKFNGLCYS